MALPVNPIKFSFRLADLEIDAMAEITRQLGYGNPQEVPAHFGEVTEEILAEASQKTTIEGGFQLWPLEFVLDAEKQLILNSMVFEVDKIVFFRLKQAEQMAVFCCTAGCWFDDYAQKAFAENDMLRGYITDVAGSILVEAGMDLLHKEIMVMAEKENLHITNRYSPGYCNWPVSEQQKLFKLLPEKFCGISLNESSLMKPVKSVSGFIGIGSRVKFDSYTCSFCDMQNCIYQKRKNSILT